MVVMEALAGVVGTSLLVVAVAGAFVGMLGVVGAVRIERCQRCGHFGLTAPREPLRRCGRCRHPRLLHPLHHELAAWHGDLPGPPSHPATG